MFPLYGLIELGEWQKRFPNYVQAMKSHVPLSGSTGLATEDVMQVESFRYLWSVVSIPSLDCKGMAGDSFLVMLTCCFGDGFLLRCEYQMKVIHFDALEVRLHVS